MKEIVYKEYDAFEKRRKEYEAIQADEQDLQELEEDVKSLQEKKEWPFSPYEDVLAEIAEKQ